jgi:hypothetical protein
MMRRSAYIFLAFVFLAAGWACPGMSSGQTKANITINAEVSDTLSFTWNMHRLLGPEDPTGGDIDQTAMSFGRLQELDPLEYPGRLFTDIWYCLFLYTSATQSYFIKQTSTSLMTLDGLNNLDKSFVVIPDYNAGEKWDGLYAQGALDAGEACGAPSLAANKCTGITLFSGTKSHIIRLYYSIPAQPTETVTGWEPISTSQPIGDYQGTVTITIVPQST